MPHFSQIPKMQVVPSWQLTHMRILLENPRLRILTSAHDTIRKKLSNWKHDSDKDVSQHMLYFRDMM